MTGQDGDEVTGWFDEEHAAWLRFLGACETFGPSEVLSLLRVSFAWETRARQAFKTVAFLRR